MTLEKTVDGDRIRLTVTGEIDTLTAPQFEGELTSAAAGMAEVTIDLAGVAYVSSAGLRVFLNAQKAANAAKGRLILANVPEQVMKIFKLTGFAKVLTFA